MASLSSKDRLLNTIKGETTDRIPVFPFNWFEYQRFIGDSDFAFSSLSDSKLDFLQGWMKRDSRLQEVVQFASENGCDILHRTSFPELDRRFLLIPDEFITKTDRQITDDLIRSEYTVHTPKGDLTYIEELKKDISTTWIKKALIENKEQAQQLLSVPYTFRSSDLSHFFEIREDLGERGLVSCFVSNPLVCISHLFDFSQFLTWCITERKLIQHLIETVYERIYKHLTYLLENGVGPIIELGGSEQATPPMMSPELFDSFVVGYDKGLIDLAHKHGCYARVHCHGNVKTVIKKFSDMHVDMLNPVEGPPSGDIELDEAQRMTNREMTLEGNIQFSNFEFSSEDEMDRKVREAINRAGKDHFVLTATEWPITYFSEQMKRNYMQFIKSGMEYGKSS